jgi:tRNA-binding protein
VVNVERSETRSMTKRARLRALWLSACAGSNPVPHITIKMEQISFDQWKKMEMKVGKIIEVEKIPRTEKLYKLKVDLGEKRIQIVTSLVPYYKEEELKDKKIIVLTNLKPTKFAGELSEGMLLCAEKEDESECVLLTIDKDIEVGTQIT